MTTKINKLSPVLLALLTLFLFASCDKEEYSNEETRGNSEKIHFEIAVGTATATPSGMETRVVTSPTYESTFENGDAIGVYIVKGSGGLQPSGNWVDNMNMTYNNGTWGYTLPSGKEYYPTDGDLLNFYAYYPYESSLADATNFTFSVQSDQHDGANLSKSDLLIASKLNMPKSNTPVLLNFSHAMAMVELKVAEGGTGTQMSNQVIPTLEGCINDVELNLATGTVTTTGAASAVTMCRVEQSTDANYLTSYTYRAFVPAQTVTANTELFRFSQTAGTITRTLSHKPPEQVVLAKSEVKPYNITLQPSIDPNYIYAVGDYYPYIGFPILGVVFEISNGGKNGKIMSLDEISAVRWGDSSIDENAAGVVGIRDQTDGQAGTKNLIVKRKDQDNFATTYGAFNWIYQTKNKGDVNGIWYMPSISELQNFRNFWDSDRSGLEAKLNAAGGGGIWDDSFYWSSCEHNKEYTYFLLIKSNHFLWDQYNKDNSHHTYRMRPISKF